MKKPTVYIVTNLGGGVRKSTTIAHLTFALQDRGEDPIIVALDANSTLENLLPEGSPIIKWDLNNTEDSYEGLQAVIDKAEESDRPVVIDLAALGGESQGIHTLLETFILEDCDVVSVVPILPTPKSIEEGIKALKLVNPDKWMLVQYGTRNHSKLYDRTDVMQELLDMEPMATIKPAELTEGQTEILQSESLPLNKLDPTTVRDSKMLRKYKVHMRYWQDLGKQYQDAIDVLTTSQNECIPEEVST